MPEDHCQFARFNKGRLEQLFLMLGAPASRAITSTIRSRRQIIACFRRHYRYAAAPILKEEVRRTTSAPTYLVA